MKYVLIFVSNYQHVLIVFVIIIRILRIEQTAKMRKWNYSLFLDIYIITQIVSRY